MPSGGVLSHLLLLVVLVAASIFGVSCSAHVVEAAAEKGAWVMKPVTAAPGAGALLLEETRRRLGSFQICALCTCCGGPRGICLPSPCCYAINCNIPNRPFGFCSFTPKSCNCLECNL